MVDKALNRSYLASSDTEFTDPSRSRSMPTLTQSAPIDFLGAAARVLAAGEDDDGRLGLVHMSVPAGHQPPLHVHRRQDEGFYVLGGELTLYLTGRTVTLRAASSSSPRAASPTRMRPGPRARSCS